jgi:uncharacterized membrane protein
MDTSGINWVKIRFEKTNLGGFIFFSLSFFLFVYIFFVVGGLFFVSIIIEVVIIMVFFIYYFPFRFFGHLKAPQPAAVKDALAIIYNALFFY